MTFIATSWPFGLFPSTKLAFDLGIRGNGHYIFRVGTWYRAGFGRGSHWEIQNGARGVKRGPYNLPTNQVGVYRPNHSDFGFQLRLWERVSGYLGTPKLPMAKRGPTNTGPRLGT